MFTRNLNDVTDRLPWIVETVARMPGGDLVLDGEALGVLDDGAPRRFQDTMGDFGAHADGSGRRGADRRRAGEWPAGVLLRRAPRRWIARCTTSRCRSDASCCKRRCPRDDRLPSIVTADSVEAQAFLERAIAAGHEGVMVKALDRPYEAGRRGSSWRKVKPVLHVRSGGVGDRVGSRPAQRMAVEPPPRGALDRPGDDASFVMVGKTFKGMTDELLRWQTERFLELEIGRDGHVVHVRPEQVVEIAVDGVQASTRYPGGVALRFARVKRYRADKAAADADTIDTVRSLL